MLGFCLGSFFGMGLNVWIPTFFIRSHGMEIGELGTWLGFVWGFSALIGTWLGGALTSRYAAGKEALQMRVMALITVPYVLFFAVVFLSSNKYIALTFVAALGGVNGLGQGPIFSAIQGLVNDRMRSAALALIFLFANLIGFGLGPLAVGVLSDLLAPMFGQESLRYALVLFCPGLLWVGVHYWKVADTIEADIRRVESAEVSAEMDADTFEPDKSELCNTSI